MPSVFVLFHTVSYLDGTNDGKLLGVYSTHELALAAAKRLSAQPGFKDWPRLLDASPESGEGGFTIDGYRVDQDHWEEGFIASDEA
jgi:hypothetical protein